MTNDPNMTDPRLLDSSPTDFESSLLKAALEEAPTRELSTKMLAPLATGAAVGTAAGGAKLLKGAVAKWLGAGASILVAGGAYYAGSTSSDGVTSPGQAPPASIVERARATDVPVTPPAKATPQVPVESSSALAPADETHKSEAPAASAPKKSSSTLAEEMALLDRARSALKSRKDPEEALRLLGVYERKYPTGALRQEATVLRVSALEESGARDRADQLKSEFLKENPKSAHKRQLENDTSLAK